MGRVLRVVPGPDGIVRSVWIWTEGSELHRPVASFCLLEAIEDPDSSPPSDDRV